MQQQNHFSNLYQTVSYARNRVASTFLSLWRTAPKAPQPLDGAAGSPTLDDIVLTRIAFGDDLPIPEFVDIAAVVAARDREANKQLQARYNSRLEFFAKHSPYELGYAAVNDSS